VGTETIVKEYMAVKKKGGRASQEKTWEPRIGRPKAQEQPRISLGRKEVFEKHARIIPEEENAGEKKKGG